MNRKKINTTALGIIFILIMIVIMQLFRYSVVEEMEYYGIQEDQENWNVQERDQGTYEMLMERRLSEEDYGKTLFFVSSYAWIIVEVDGEVIYQRETYFTPKNPEAPTNGSNYVELPDHGERIAIHVYSPYYVTKSYMSSIEEGEYYALKFYHNKGNMFNFFMDMALCVLGILSVFYGVYWQQSKGNGKKLIYLGILAINFAVWFVTGTEDIELDHISSGLMMNVSFISWLLVPLTFNAFMMEYNKNITRGYRILHVLGAANLIGNLVFYGLGIFDFIEMIVISHFILLVTGSFMIYRVFHQGVKRFVEQTGFERVGLVFLGLCALVELFLYYIRSISIGYWVRIGVFMFLIAFAISEIVRRERSKKEILQHEADLKKEQLAITLSQFQPHFLFNALGAIRLSVRMNPTAAYEMIYDFSKFLRGSLNALQEEGVIPFLKELEQIKAYLNIEQERFSHRITVRYDIQCEDFMIPPLTIQPLVANAVNHGLKKNGGTIYIRTYEKNETAIIEIKDDGVGFHMSIVENQERSRDNYTKISNIQSRLGYQTGGSIHVESAPGQGTLIRITVPKQGGKELEEHNR